MSIKGTPKIGEVRASVMVEGFEFLRMNAAGEVLQMGGAGRKKGG